MAGLRGLLAVLIWAPLWTGCGEEPAPPPPTPVVRTAVAALSPAESRAVYPGSVKGRYESRLGFQVGGKIMARHVDLGDLVQPGQALLELDPKDLEETARMARAQMDAARSKLNLAEVDFQRYERLYRDGVTAKAQYDQYQTAYDSALDGHKQAQAQYNQAQNALGYSRLTADGQGVVAELDAEVGQVVAAGQPVVTVVRAGALEVEITVPENRLNLLSLGLEARVSFWARPDLALKGRLREISPMADPATRTYTARVSLDSPPPEVRLGMTASVLLADRRPEASRLLLPLSAIYQAGSGPGVWVVREGRLTLRPVTTADFDDNQVVIVSGLEAGEVVVTAGVHKLYEGQAVRLMDEKR